jgi:DNA-binding protein Fis
MTLSRGKPITACCLPAHLVKKIKRLKTGSQASPEPLPTLAELEKDHIVRVYRMTDRNKAESARMLGIGINTLRRKLSEYGIS